MGPGTRRLLRLSVPSPAKAVEKQLDTRTRLVLGANPDGSLAALLDDCADAAVAALAPKPVWSRAEFAALRDRVAAALAPTTLDIVGRVAEGARRRCTRCRSRCPPRRRPPRPTPSPTSARSWPRCCPRASSPPPGPRTCSTWPATSPPIGRRLERLPQGVGGRPRADGPGARRCRTRYDELRRGAFAGARGRRRRPRHRAADRGVPGEPVGAAARHRAAGQRAAHLPRDRRHHAPERVLDARRRGHPQCGCPLRRVAVSGSGAPWCRRAGR